MTRAPTRAGRSSGTACERERGTGRRRAAALAALVAAAVMAAGCGTPSADLFVVTRSGTVPGAKLKLLVDDGGQVRCNDGERRPISSQQLLDARELARRLGEDADRHLALPPRAGSVLRYRVEVQDGVVRFADTSRPRRPELAQLQEFTRQVAIGVCGLPR